MVVRDYLSGEICSVYWIYKPEGVEIKLFSEFQYDDKIELEIIIPKVESNIFFSEDYRIKEEIENIIQKSKIWDSEILSRRWLLFLELKCNSLSMLENEDRTFVLTKYWLFVTQKV